MHQIVVLPEREMPVVLLGAIVRKIGANEPDLVSLIHSFVNHNFDATHRVGCEAFAG